MTACLDIFHTPLAKGPVCPEANRIEQCIIAALKDYE